MSHRVELSLYYCYDFAFWGNSSYTFTMPAGQVTVSVTFTQSTYTITASKTEHGTLSFNPASAKMGTSVTVTAAPDNGYEAKSVTAKTADGKTVEVSESDGKYLFKMPAGNVTVSCAFTEKRVGDLTDVKGTDWFYDDVNWAYYYKP